MAASTNPFLLAGPATQLHGHLFDTWARIGTVYKNAFDTSAYDLFASSARIVQEHTVRAVLAASQSCAQALAQNTAKVQQHTLDRVLAANQKAVDIMGQSWIDWMTPR